MIADEAQEAFSSALADAAAAGLRLIREAVASGRVPTRASLVFRREHDPKTGQVTLHHEESPQVVDLDSVVIRLLPVLGELPEMQELLIKISQNHDLADAILIDAAGKPLEEGATQKWWLEFIVAPFLHYMLALINDAPWDQPAFEVVFSDLMRHERTPFMSPPAVRAGCW